MAADQMGLAAGWGHAGGEFSYTACLQHGLEVAQSMSEYTRYLKMAADQEDAAIRGTPAIWVTGQALGGTSARLRAT